MHYEPQQELTLCDASPYGVGAVLSIKWKWARLNTAGIPGFKGVASSFIPSTGALRASAGVDPV